MLHGLRVLLYSLQVLVLRYVTLPGTCLFLVIIRIMIFLRGIQVLRHCLKVLQHGLHFLFNGFKVLIRGLQVKLHDTQVSLALFYGLQVK
jgi:hypothetical protein